MTPASIAAGTIAEALVAAGDALAAAGCETPRLDAEVLLGVACGVDRARLAAHPEAPVNPGSARRFGEMVRRRVRREPVAYILGHRGFRHLDLLVDDRALVPRPETELVVEVAVELRPHRVLDVGTGSGAIALALAAEMPDAEVVATDLSPAALDLAAANAARLGLAERLRLERGTLPAAGTFDLLVANLPYVSDGEWAGLVPEINAWEPREALVAGPTGLEAISSLLELLAERPLAPAIALEVGAGQAQEVLRLAASAGYGRGEVRRDLAGIDRVVVAAR